MAEQKTYEFKVYTGNQNWEGIYKCNGGKPQIVMNADLNCTKEDEKAFHRWLEGTEFLSKTCNGINDLKFEESSS